MNMVEEFNVMDKVMMGWFNKISPGFISVEIKPRPLINERHKISCGLTSILWIYQIVEGKDHPQQLRQK